MTKPSVYIQEPWGRQSREMFARYGYPIVETPEACDIICFNGGEDINPALYKQEPLKGAYVHFDQSRDERELAGYKRAKDKFKFGICRGGQLLNVLNGGSLWQDVDGHERPHYMLDVVTNETIFTSSIHHQQFIPSPEAVIVAKCNESENKFGCIPESAGTPMKWQRRFSAGPDFDAYYDDLEVLWYPKDKALCIQGHPEYGGYSQMTEYCMSLIERYY